MVVTWDPVNISAALTLSNGNLTATNGSTAAAHTRATQSQASGVYYCELHIDLCSGFGDTAVGLLNASESFSTFLGHSNNSIGWYDDGNVFLNNAPASIATIQTYTTNDVVSMAVNASTRRVWWRTNAGNWNNDVIANQNPAAGIGGIDISAIAGALFPGNELESTTEAATVNFGASSYAQSVPSGYLNWGFLLLPDVAGYVNNEW